MTENNGWRKINMKYIYVVIDIRDDEICWNGTKKDCKWWLSMTDPDNRPYYKIMKLEELENAKLVSKQINN